VNLEENSQENMVQEENRKTYTALLQNQVLGVTDGALLREIHQRQEEFAVVRPYTAGIES
jgi:hypothetical protein